MLNPVCMDFWKVLLFCNGNKIRRVSAFLLGRLLTQKASTREIYRVPEIFHVRPEAPLTKQGKADHQKHLIK
jgi:hypothetical protein